MLIVLWFSLPAALDGAWASRVLQHHSCPQTRVCSGCHRGQECHSGGCHSKEWPHLPLDWQEDAGGWSEQLSAAHLRGDVGWGQIPVKFLPSQQSLGQAEPSILPCWIWQWMCTGSGAPNSRRELPPKGRAHRYHTPSVIITNLCCLWPPVPV